MKNERKILEKTIKDSQKVIDKAKKDLGALEVTYSIGDRFTTSLSGEKIILVQLCGGLIGAASLKDGSSYGVAAEKFDNKKEITQRQLERIISNPRGAFTRYWDSRKQVNV